MFDLEVEESEVHRTVYLELRGLMNLTDENVAHKNDLIDLFIKEQAIAKKEEILVREEANAASVHRLLSHDSSTR